MIQALKNIIGKEAAYSGRCSNIGAIHLWHPHGGGSGSGGRMWTGGGIKPHVDVHTEN